MTFEEYQVESRRTQNKALPLWATREHALYGLASEVGEVLWFISELCDVYGFDLGEIAAANIQKLRVRYKDHFTEEESRARVDVKKPVKTKYYSRVKEVKGNV